MHGFTHRNADWMAVFYPAARPYSKATDEKMSLLGSGWKCRIPFRFSSSVTSQFFYQFLMFVNAELDEFFHVFGPSFIQKAEIRVFVIRVKCE